MSTKTSTNFISGFQRSTRKKRKEGEKEKGKGTKQDIDKRKNEELDLLKKREWNNKRELWVADIARRRFQNSILPALVLVTSRIKGIEFH